MDRLKKDVELNPDSFVYERAARFALGESDANNPILDKIASLLNVWPSPYLNLPQKIKDCARQKITNVLSGIPNVVIPETYRMLRNDLDTKKFPITIRPLDTHGGRGFEKIESTGSLNDYLNRYTECEEFYMCPFIDYMSIDGHYRKWRIALIDKKPYICHLAISNNWMVHFQSSGMEEDESKRREEKYNMENFDDDFAQRHKQSLYAIADRLALDYVIIDCAETQKGELLLFEADVRGWIHATDPIDIFPYKPVVMQKAFDAFRELLSSRIRQVEL
jgi:glutathione synthase/RimK-type ligase-like ATP-grasp enzyme